MRLRDFVNGTGDGIFETHYGVTTVWFESERTAIHFEQLYRSACGEYGLTHTTRLAVNIFTLLETDFHKEFKTINWGMRLYVRGVSFVVIADTLTRQAFANELTRIPFFGAENLTTEEADTILEKYNVLEDAWASVHEVGWYIG